jgi:hypothetical protein
MGGFKPTILTFHLSNGHPEVRFPAGAREGSGEGLFTIFLFPHKQSLCGTIIIFLNALGFPAHDVFLMVFPPCRGQ